MQLLRELRIPAILQLRNQVMVADGPEEADENTATAATADAEVEALLLGLMDASAAYDIAMLPLLGATGPRAEADAAKAMSVLSTASAAGGLGKKRRLPVAQTLHPNLSPLPNSFCVFLSYTIAFSPAFPHTHRSAAATACL